MWGLCCHGKNDFHFELIFQILLLYNYFIIVVIKFVNNDHYYTTYFKFPLSIFKTQTNLWITTTYQQRPLFLGSKLCRCAIVIYFTQGIAGLDSWIDPSGLQSNLVDRIMINNWKSKSDFGFGLSILFCQFNPNAKNQNDFTKKLKFHSGLRSNNEAKLQKFQTLIYQQAIAQSDYFGLPIQSKSITNMWLTIQIQISKWIENPIQIQSQSNYIWKKICDNKF